MKFRKDFFRFCIAGVIGFLFDVGVLYFSAKYLGWYVARVLSFLVAVTVTWQINRRFTFRAENITKGNLQIIFFEYFNYLASMIIGAVINFSIYSVVVRWLDVPLAAMLGVALGSIGGLFVNFFSARNFVFK